MASGFSRDTVYTKFGREVKPTSRVQAILVESLVVASDRFVKHLEDHERLLRRMIESRDSDTEIKSVYVQWNELFRELQAVDAEYRRIAKDLSDTSHVDRVSQALMLAENFELELCEFLEIEPLEQEPAPAKCTKK